MKIQKSDCYIIFHRILYNLEFTVFIKLQEAQEAFDFHNGLEKSFLKPCLKFFSSELLFRYLVNQRLYLLSDAMLSKLLHDT